MHLSCLSSKVAFMGQECPGKVVLDVDNYERKSLKNLSQVYSEAINSEETSEVAVQAF